MFKPEDLYQTPNQLARYYKRFRVTERLLLTGHSHQAWPDRGFEGQQRAWLDAAELVDDKWERAFAVADEVRRGYASLLGDDSGYIALASNTHDLVIRFLSALPLRERPRIVTTDGEYHTLRRQLDRLGEERIEIVKVPAHPAADVSGRLAAAVDERTAAVCVSSVYYQTAHIVPNLGDVMAACEHEGTDLLVDAYHQLNVVPCSLKVEGLDRAFVVGGGYKYCQLGEGNCFMRLPADCAMRPVVTGWFSEFGALADAKDTSTVVYGSGAERFAGSTYDPTSHYRAAAVFDFFKENGLTPQFLRVVNQHQLHVLAKRFDAIEADPGIILRNLEIDLGDVGGFLVLETPHAETIYKALHAQDVVTDYRGDYLRLGPAPYLSDRQLNQAMDILESIIREWR
jgi:kynureninase